MTSHKIYRPSELKTLLEAHGTTAKKKFSQNFLIDYNILKKIVKTADVHPDDLVIEIGAGPGALTQVLLEHTAHVIAIEVDAKLIELLKQLQEGENSLEIIHADVLKLPLEDLCKEKGKEKAGHHRKIKVVANLPYHITTPILTRLLPLHHSIESLTVMVQKEFAERMASKPATSSYSSFTLFVEYYSDARLCFTISPSCFYPAPKVHSAIVKCTLHPPALEEKDTALFFTLTRSAFQKRRKMLRTSLKGLYPVARLDEAFEKMRLNAKVRPEELSLAQFLTLFRLL